MSGHAGAPPPKPAAAAGDAHSVGRPVRDLAAEIYVQLIAKVPDPGTAESMARLSFKLAELCPTGGGAGLEAPQPDPGGFRAESSSTTYH